MKGGDEGQSGVATHTTAERLEGIHRLFVTRAVFAELACARRARGRRREWVERGLRAVLPVALHVADLLVELKVVGLEAADFGAQFGDHLELFAELLSGGK